VEYEWDEAKRRTNRLKHGVDFAHVAALDWDSATIRIDARRPYGEIRFRAQALIEGELFLLVFTTRGDRIRVISLRAASRKEKQAYAEAP
jgi:uncharacterized DUF497 family protein